MTTTEPQLHLRPVALDDAAALAGLYRAQREFLAPFEPVRPASFFTESGQRVAIRDALAAAEADRGRRFLIYRGDDLVGVIAVSNVVRGAFESGNLGYFVAQEWNGHGIATAAVGLACAWAFEEAKLHRLEAGTLVDNVRSQRVLLRNGFRPIGLAPRYLRIGGEWRDHILFSKLADG